LIAVDTNILVYAHREDSPFHDPAATRIAELAEGSATWSIPWPCVHEFLAIVTHPRIYEPPTPLPRALDQVDAWLASPTLVLLAESANHWPALRKTLASRPCANSTACGSYGPRIATSIASRAL
jgi:predicted nucleic acid-binding protein